MNYYVIPGLASKNNTRGTSQRLTHIAEIVSDYFGIEHELFFGELRVQEISLARFYFMYYIRKTCNYNLTEIGRVLNKHHSSVIYGINTLENLMYVDKDYRKTLNNLEGYINLKLN